MSLTFIAEQEVFLVDQAGSRQRVVLRITAPEERADDDGTRFWDCAPRLDGLVDIRKSVSARSSLGAMIKAIAGMRQILRDFAKGKKVFLAHPFKPGEMDPEGEVSLKELFELH
jgi:hypothetical protein